MPPKFEKCHQKPGSKIRTVTKGKSKGKLICIPKKGHVVLGNKRGK